MLRSSPPEVLSTTLCKLKANPHKNNRAEARSQQSRFATLLKSHPRTDVPPRIRSTPAETSLQENISGGLLLCVKKVLKVLNNKKLLFTFAKRNLLTVKSKQINKQIYK